jgi:hypothetical protein
VAVFLNFTFGSLCGGGNHVPVTAALTGDIVRSKTVMVRRDTLLLHPDDDETQATVEVLLRILIRQIAVKTNANIKAKVEATTINLTVSP